jgi:hypothetical protein
MQTMKHDSEARAEAWLPGRPTPVRVQGKSPQLSTTLYNIVETARREY